MRSKIRPLVYLMLFFGTLALLASAATPLHATSTKSSSQAVAPKKPAQPAAALPTGLTFSPDSSADEIVIDIPPNDDDLPRDFLRLADLRDRVNAAISTARLALARKTDQKENTIPQLDNELKTLQEQQGIAKNKKEQTIDPFDSYRIARDTSTLEHLRAVTSVDSFRRLNDQLIYLTAGLRRIEKKMSNTSDPQQTFKTSISGYFTILVGVVIAGFFVLAFKDVTMRRAIFRGQAGIQFLTLFSLVIAIILFGITGVLEAKELAALLGGISGYILGRTASEPAPSKADQRPDQGDDDKPT